MSYDDAKTYYNKAVNKNALYYVQFPIGSDIDATELIHNYLGENPSVWWDKSDRKNGKKAMNVHGGAPTDTEDFEYSKGIK